MENNNEQKRKSLILSEFDVNVILDCLNKELSNERTDWGPVWEKDQNGYNCYNCQPHYQYRGITKRGKQIQSTIKYIKSQIQ